MGEASGCVLRVVRVCLGESGSYQDVFRDVKSVSSDVRNVSGYVNCIVKRLIAMLLNVCKLNVDELIVSNYIAVSINN